MKNGFLFLVILMLASSAFAQDSIPSLNKQILKLANDQLGKKVDRGECWDLAAYVLNKTGAEWDGLYEYGKKVNFKKDVIYPGDIIQFEKVVLKYKEGNKEYTVNLYHHTAIVKSVDGKLKFTVLEQNTDTYGKKVSTSTIDLSTMIKGKIQFYRPFLEE